MRLVRLALPLVVAAIAVAGCGGKSNESSSQPAPVPAHGKSAGTPSGQTVQLGVRVKPPQAGGGATIEYHAVLGTRTGAKPGPVDQITFRAQRGFKLNASGFPSCSVDDLKAGHVAACKKAAIGDGKAQVISPKGDRLTSRITTYLGGTHGSSTTFLYYVTTPGYSPIPAAATVSKLGSGPWAYTITYPPLSKALPLAKLDLRTFGKTSKSGHHLIETPAKCAGSWRFDSRVSYRSGEKLIVPASAKCSS